MATPDFRKIHTLTSAVAGAGTPQILQNFPVTVTVVADGSNTGYVETTNCPRDMIEADTAIWEAWPEGTVSAEAFDTLLGPVTAARLVSVAGTITGYFQESSD